MSIITYYQINKTVSNIHLGKLIQEWVSIINDQNIWRHDTCYLEHISHSS